MICRKCATEISDKALICYRCGTATTEATFKPATLRRSPSWLLTALVVLALAIIAVYASRTPGETSRVLSWIAMAAAVAVVGIRAYLRRRR